MSKTKPLLSPPTDEDVGNAGYLPLDKGFSTRAIHASQDPGQWNCKAIVAPITTSSTFRIEDLDYSKGYQYGRWANPSRDILEKCLASLENAKYGLCYASGMGAVTGVVQLLNAGDHVLCASDVYGGTHHHIAALSSKNGLDCSFFDPLDQNDLENSIKSNTKMVWVESPTNPLMKIIDLARVAQTCRKVSKDIIVVVDNTFLTSYYQKPLELGAHVVMYSLTKYMNGHADVIMGAAVTNDDSLHKRLRYLQNYLGIIAAPFDCHMVTRGLKTLAVRLQAHMKGSLRVAKFLEEHPRAEKVLHPGLASHPQHELSKKQASGHSGMLAFHIKGADQERTLKFLKALKVIQFAGSLGGVESLAESPALLSHGAVPADERRKIGIMDNLVRLSVGLEDPDDLCQDLDQAFQAAFTK